MQNRVLIFNGKLYLDQLVEGYAVRSTVTTSTTRRGELRGKL